MNTHSPLTRTEVEERIQWYGENFVLYRKRWANELLDTDAALRRTIEQQAQEIERENTRRLEAIEDKQYFIRQLAAMTTERDEAMGHAASMSNDITHLGEQLATAQAERDAARSAAREIITKLEAERDAANAERQRAVDSLAKYIARVRELEEALQHAREDF